VSETDPELDALPDLDDLDAVGASEPAPGEERRADDRRGSDRRRFRDSPGRRDPDRPRRKEDRRRRLPARWLMILLVLGTLALGYRAWFVAPRRGAAIEAQAVLQQVAPILSTHGFPLQAVPGFAPPVEGDPAEGLVLHPDVAEQLGLLSSRLDAAISGAPLQVDPYGVLAPVRFALGDERGARLAWEQVLALGEPDDQDAARVGIATLQLRAGLRSPDEQDRRFAIEAAVRTLEPVLKGSPAWTERLVAEGVARLALGQEDEADAVLAELRNAAGPVADAALPLLQARRSGEESLSATLDAALESPPAEE